MARAMLDDVMFQIPDRHLTGLEKPTKINVKNFLSKYQYLFPLLSEAIDEIRKYFPSEALKLEVVSDSEVETEEKLFVYILTSLSVEDALQKLNEFDENWWLDRLDLANGLLNFNLRFV